MMGSIWMRLQGLRRALGILVLSAPILGACAKPTLPVNIHGVNYSAEVFSFVIVDPNDSKNTGGSGLIDPYAAGGTSCCYELPKKWRDGMKATIQSTHWLGKLADKTLREVETTYTVAVPRYADGKPGELWVLRAADGTMGLVSSDFQPDHAKWPGSVKGWPVPSIAYQRERWDLYIHHEKMGVELFEKSLIELNETPDLIAKQSWDFSLEHHKKSLVGYSGPTDQKYREMLRVEFAEALERGRRNLEKLEKGRP